MNTFNCDVFGLLRTRFIKTKTQIVNNDQTFTECHPVVLPGHFLNKICWVYTTLGSPDWTVSLNKICWVYTTLGSPDLTVSLNKICWVYTTLGSPDWTVSLNVYTVHVVPARIMQPSESLLYAESIST